MEPVIDRYKMIQYFRCISIQDAGKKYKGGSFMSPYGGLCKMLLFHNAVIKFIPIGENVYKNRKYPSE